MDIKNNEKTEKIPRFFANHPENSARFKKSIAFFQNCAILVVVLSHGITAQITQKGLSVIMYTDQNGKTWYKGNLHTHTTNSDGRKSPEDVIALYRAHGYDFLALTDHWKRSETSMTDDGMLLLSGVEYNINGADIIKGVFHIVCIGAKGDPASEWTEQTLTAQNVIHAIHAHGGLAILAHPAWSMNTVDQIMSLEDIDATEIYNSVSGLPYNCRPDSGIVIDQCAARGRALPCTAADDSHFYCGEECYSYIYVQADALTEDSLLDAIRAGRFYATQGPRFSITVTEDADAHTKTVMVSCAQPEGAAPIKTVVFYTGSVWCSGRSVNGDTVTEASFVMQEKDRFVRVECIDTDGRRGFGTPILF